MSFLISHSTLQFTIWAILTLILLIVVVIYTLYRRNEMRKEEDDLRDELEKLCEKNNTGKTA